MEDHRKTNHTENRSGWITRFPFTQKFKGEALLKMTFAETQQSSSYERLGWVADSFSLGKLPKTSKAGQCTSLCPLPKGYPAH